MKTMINPEKFYSSKEGQADLGEIYRRTAIFLDNHLPAIEKGTLEVLGALQRNDLRTLIEKSNFTDPPILHSLELSEIEELKKYIEESESQKGYTVNIPILVSALVKLRNTLKERLEGEKKY